MHLELSVDYQRENLLRLPLPLAQLYSRAHNSNHGRGRHDNCFYLLEALIKLTACPLIAAYVESVATSGPHGESVDRLLPNLARPALGHWVALLRETSRHFAKHNSPNPFAHVYPSLNEQRRGVPAILALYRRVKHGPDGRTSGDTSVSLLELFDVLVEYRNRVFGHGAERETAFYDEQMWPLLFPAINEILSESVLNSLWPKDCRFVLISAIKSLDEQHADMELRELTGLQSERAARRFDKRRVDHLAPEMVVLLWPTQTLPLKVSPLLHFQKREQNEEVSFVNRRWPNGDVEYLNYTTGRTTRDSTAAAAFERLLNSAAQSKAASPREQAHGKEEPDTKSVRAADVGDSTAARKIRDTPPAIVTPSGKNPKTAVWTPDPSELADDGHDALPEKIDRYFVLRELGTGGFARVYLAKDPQHNRLVAIKVPRKEKLCSETAVEDFLKEARTAAQLEHPGIVPVYDFGRTDDGYCFVVMQYIEGQSLQQLIDSGKTDHQTTAKLIAQVAEALHYAHRKGLVHRDIKPANILLDKDGKPHISDFGLALHDDDLHQHENEIAGTVAYMSPEQLRGETHCLDGRSDLWGIGVIFYRMLSNRLPFVASGFEERFVEVQKKDPKPPRVIDASIAAELEQACLTCLEKLAGDRFRGADQLAVILRSWLALQDKPSTRQRVGRLLVVVGILATAVAATYVVVHERSEAPVFTVRQSQSERPPFSEIQWSPWSRILLDGTHTLFQTDANAEIVQTADSIRVTSRQPLALKIGSVAASDIPYQIRFQVYVSPEVQDYRGGICLGYRHDVFLGSHDQYNFQEFSIRDRFDARPSVNRMLNSARLAPGRRPLLDERVVENTLLDTRTPETGDQLHATKIYTVELGVSGNGVESVAVNGTDLSVLCTADFNSQTSDQDYLGTFGIIHYQGAAEYKDFQIRHPKVD